MRRFSLLAFTMMVAGCAGESEMRSVSGQSASILNQYRGAFRDFASRQNESNAANAARLARLNGLRDERSGEIQARTRAWRVIDDRNALSAFATLTAVDAAAIVAALDAPTQVTDRPTLRFDASATDALVNQLVELQRPSTPTERAQEFVGFLLKLRESYQSAVGEAAQEAGAAGEATATTTQAAVEDRAAEEDEED